MQVDVRLLRGPGGLRLPRERVRAAVSTRGRLVIEKHQLDRDERPVAIARLVGLDLVTDLLPPLEDVQILRWRGSDVVLAGLEHHQLHRKCSWMMRQAWWVQISEGAAPVVPVGAGA